MVIDDIDAIYHTISGTTMSSLTSTIRTKMTLEQKCICSIYIIDSEGDTFNLHIGQFSGNSGLHHIAAYFNWMRLTDAGGVVERRLDMQTEKYYKIVWTGSSTPTMTKMTVSSWTIYYTGHAIS